jgi:DNA-directed RNA polymerase subunit M/transcription elongation factor TFIIS
MLSVQKAADNSKIFLCKFCKNTYPYEENNKSNSKITSGNNNDDLRYKPLNKNRPNIVDNGENVALCSMEQICPKCGYNHAYMFEMPPVYGDEESFTRYKCAKCHHVWVEGSAEGGH